MNLFSTSFAICIDKHAPTTTCNSTNFPSTSSASNVSEDCILQSHGMEEETFYDQEAEESSSESDSECGGTVIDDEMIDILF